ncbi:MAG: hypothetical protein AB2L24_07850 [Mangrovibacterium sp.]
MRTVIITSLSVLVIFPSCQLHEELAIPVPLLSTNDARSFYESSLPKVVLPGQRTLQDNKRLSVPADEIVTYPEWGLAKETQNSKLSVVEVPIMSNHQYAYINSKADDQAANPDGPNSFSRLVLLRNLETGQMRHFVMTFVWDRDYDSTAGKNRFNNRYLSLEQDFYGEVYFSTIKGKVYIGYVIKNGKRVSKLFPPGTKPENLNREVPDTYKRFRKDT